MNTKILIRAVTICVMVLIGLQQLSAQKKDTVQLVLPNKEYVFSAQAYMSASASTRQLVPGEYSAGRNLEPVSYNGYVVSK